jgi:phosphoenolpyruvate carboxykinase (ATP)
MFIEVDPEEMENFTPRFTILNACKTTCPEPQKWGLRSEVFVAFNIAQGLQLIGGTWYGGEIKKGMFSMMNYFLTLKGVAAMHCSANMGENGDTALFFGLSGTGKTTLSTDPKRKLIGDDEHGWDDQGVFNLEGGCYAKIIDLCQEKEPDIYKAIRRNALLENVVLMANHEVDFTDNSKTENTRVSYPLNHIDNIVQPSRGGHPRKIIFLTCDALGVLPPVAKLSTGQALYHYLSGYTAKVSGTEMGVTEPTATFSACFGAPFLSVHPLKYVDILQRKIDEHSAKVYLVNTGWTAGGVGTGHRLSVHVSRAIIDGILDDSIEQSTFQPFDVFGFQIPTQVQGVPDKILDPRQTWADSEAYDRTRLHLASLFQKSFTQFGIDELVQHGPQ